MKKDISVLGKGKSDPYAIINVGAQEFKTQIIDNNVNPKWDYWCEVRIPWLIPARIPRRGIPCASCLAFCSLPMLSIDCCMIQSNTKKKPPIYCIIVRCFALVLFSILIFHSFIITRLLCLAPERRLLFLLKWVNLSRFN